MLESYELPGLPNPASVLSIQWTGLFTPMILYIQRGQLVVGATSAQAPTEHVLACVLRQRNVLTVLGADQVLFWMAYILIV